MWLAKVILITFVGVVTYVICLAVKQKPVGILIGLMTFLLIVGLTAETIAPKVETTKGKIEAVQGKIDGVKESIDNLSNALKFWKSE